jgi:hypothetical protein
VTLDLSKDFGAPATDGGDWGKGVGGEAVNGWIICFAAKDLSEAETCLKSSIIPFRITTSSSTLLVSASTFSLSALIMYSPFQILIT